MGITVDFTNVQGEFEPLPKGRYDAVVYEVELRESQAGKPYLNWQFKIVGGEYDNRRVFTTTSLQSQALWKLKQILGRIAPHLDLDGPVDIDPDELAGLPCRVVIDHEQYEGQTRDRVVDVLAPKASDEGDDLPFLK